MIGFYKRNLDYLVQHSVAPDRRRHLNKDEPPRHYIDLDYYTSKEDTIPFYWDKAIGRFSEDTLKKHGLLPWHLNREMHFLTEAFRKKDINAILYYSANIAHYISDACVPLHTTSNYNGQRTGQHGIHALWESRIPELRSEELHYFTGRASYFADPLNEIWNTVWASFSRVDSVLGLEKALDSAFPSDQKYCFDSEKQGKREYSPVYAKKYDDLMNNMIQRRLLESIRMTGSLWYTAWVNAGQPDISAIRERAQPLKQEEAQSTEEISGHVD
jgi:hypothetical protein